MAVDMTRSPKQKHLALFLFAFQVSHSAARLTLRSDDGPFNSKSAPCRRLCAKYAYERSGPLRSAPRSSRTTDVRVSQVESFDVRCCTRLASRGIGATR